MTLGKDMSSIVDVWYGALQHWEITFPFTHLQMVVNTCKELWLQLEEERLTREHLQQQLQQQGNVITTLTAVSQAAIFMIVGMIL